MTLAISDQSDRLRMLEEENSSLRERVAWLEREFVGDLLIPLAWRLTASEARLTAVLLKRPQASRSQLHAALYFDGRDEADPKIVDVCKIRKKLAPFGISILNVWGQGYAIEDPRRSQLLEELERSCPAPRNPIRGGP